MENKEEYFGKILITGSSQKEREEFLRSFFRIDKENNSKVKVSLNKKNEENYECLINEEKVLNIILKEENEELKRDLINQNNSEEIKEWYTSVFYLTDSYNAEKSIRNFAEAAEELNVQKINIIIKSSENAASDIEKLETENPAEKKYRLANKTINNMRKEFKNTEIIFLNSQSKEIKNDFYDFSDKDYQAILKNFWSSVSRKISQNYSEEMFKEISYIFKEYKEKTQKYIKNNISFLNAVSDLDKIDEEINKIMEKMESERDDKIREINKSYKQKMEPLNHIFNSYYQAVFHTSEKIIDEKYGWQSFGIDFSEIALDEDGFDEAVDNSKIGKIIKEIDEMGDDEEFSLKDMGRLFKAAAGMMFKMKSTFLECTELVFKNIENNFTKEKIEKNTYAFLMKKIIY